MGVPRRIGPEQGHVLEDRQVVAAMFADASFDTLVKFEGVGAIAIHESARPRIEMEETVRLSTPRAITPPAVGNETWNLWEKFFNSEPESDGVAAKKIKAVVAPGNATG